MYYSWPKKADGGARDAALELAMSRVGHLGPTAQSFFVDCDSTGGFDFPVGGTGVLAVSTTVGGGLWNFSTGTTVGSFVGARLVNQAQVLTRLNSRKWHLAVRMAVTVAAAAGLEFRCGTFANYVGHVGSISATNYVGVVGATNLVSTRAITTAQRVLELWGLPGTGVFLSVDDEVPVAGAATTPGSAYPFGQAFNGATATDVTGVCEWMGFYSERDV